MGITEPGVMQKITRYLFIGFNVVFTVFGFGLVIAGSVGVAEVKTLDWNDLKNLINLSTIDSKDVLLTEQAARAALSGIAGVVIVMGLITMIISFCGWFGACKQNSCLLFSFSVSMAIIVLLEFILGITVLVVVKKFADPTNQEAQSWIHGLIAEAEQEYLADNNGTSLTIAFDEMQENGSCCGLNGPEDWEEGKEPPSCYPEKDKTQKIYQVGCFEAYSDDIIRISKGVGGVAVAFCVIEIFGLIISCYLACNMKKGTPYEQH